MNVDVQSNCSSNMEYISVVASFDMVSILILLRISSIPAPLRYNSNHLSDRLFSPSPLQSLRLQYTLHHVLWIKTPDIWWKNKKTIAHREFPKRVFRFYLLQLQLS